MVYIKIGFSNININCLGNDEFIRFPIPPAVMITLNVAMEKFYKKRLSVRDEQPLIYYE